MNYQITLDADSPTRNSLTYYGAWPMMIVWGLDLFIRFVSLVTINFGYLNPWSSQNSKKKLDAVVEVLSPDYVRVSLHRSKHFHWRPGQNVYLSFPSISTFPFESHPFTISTIDDDSKSDGSTLVFILRVQRGFTKKLLKEASSDTTYKVFLNGPYGSPPLLMGYQTVILIAGLFFLSLHLALFIICVIGGSGVAFTLSLFLDILRLIFSFASLFYLCSYLSIIAEPDLARMFVKRSCLFGPSVTLVCLPFSGYL